MNTVLKLTIQNISSKKFRSFMLLASIVISAALVYTVLMLSRSTEELFLNNIENEYGNTDILINKEDYTFFDNQLSFNESKYDYVLESINIHGYTYLSDDVAINIKALSIDDFESVYDVKYLEKQKSTFEGNYFLIGEENAKKYNLFVGDEVQFTIMGIEETFILWGIIEEGSSYLDVNLNVIDVLLDPTYIKDIFEIDQSNQVLIKAREDSDLGLIIEKLRTKFPLLKVNHINNQAEVKELTRMISIPLALMSSAVILISSFIIYSTYKIITLERMPLMGTLRSIGATKRMTVGILLIESAIYGLIGGIFGIFIGIGFIYLIFQVILAAQDISFNGISYLNTYYIIITIIMAVFLSVVSSIIPIVRVSNYSIKSIMFGEIKNKKELSFKRSIIGFALIFIPYIIITNNSGKYGLLYAIIGTFSSIIGGVLIIPLLVKVLNGILKIVLTPLFKNKVDIALKNINNDKTLMNNIVLLATGLGVIFMVSNFSTSVSDAVTNGYKGGQFDLVVYYNLDKEFINSLDDIDMIENTYAAKSISYVETDKNFSLIHLEGVDPEAFNERAWNEFTEILSEDFVEKFNSEKSIVITDFISRKYDVNIGDKIGLDFNGEFVEYKVIETISSVMNNGNLSFINVDNFNDDIGSNSYQSLYIDVNGEIDKVKKEIKEAYPYGILPINSLEELRKTNENNNNMIFILMRSISIMVMFIGSIGIFNNFFISFISRRKLIASLRALGLSISNTVKLFIVESLVCGIIGSLIGLVYGVILYIYLGLIMEESNITVEILAYNISDILFVLVSGIILSIVASIIPSLNISKQNIVSQIKYE